MGTNAPPLLNRIFQDTAMAGLWHRTPPEIHILIVVCLAFVVHLLVKIVRHISEWGINKSHAEKNPFGFVTQQPKFITLTRLIVSAITFMIYFLAIGFVLVQGFHVNLTTYLASASIIGFAISFGSQSLVQDLVTGVTLIFSNAMDVGDIVDFSGTIGRLERIGLRFTKLINFYNQEIYVPNRNILNVARFPHDGIHAYADIQIPAQADQQKIIKKIEEVAKGTWMQFGGIILSEPELGNVETTEPGGWNYLRVQFKIWPGQGTLIENTFRQQINYAMKQFDPNYADWMVTVTYRTIKKSPVRSNDLNAKQFSNHRSAEPNVLSNH
jgi:moderate conductance mechanosensitive channel